MELKKKISLFSFLFLIVLTFGIFLEFRKSQGFLSVSVLDIGQGDAILIQSPNGNNILLDGGPDKKVVSALTNVLHIFKKEIDSLIISNPDKDHIAGFVDVLKRFKVNRVYEPGTINNSEIYKKLSKEIENRKIERAFLREGMKIVLDERRQIFLETIFPDSDVSKASPNDGSFVFKLTYGKTCFLLQGDAPSSVEKYIIFNLKKDVLCDVLKVGHHGSRTSTSKEYLEKVKPKFALISLGEKNSYGHPHKETLDNLNSFGVEILRTDELGTVTVFSDGERVWRKY